jgi:hypothetical protein
MSQQLEERIQAEDDQLIATVVALVQERVKLNPGVRLRNVLADLPIPSLSLDLSSIFNEMLKDGTIKAYIFCHRDTEEHILLFPSEVSLLPVSRFTF